MAKRYDFYHYSKYNNKKEEVDGIVFDSKKEAKRYQELKLLEQAGEIKNLQLQVKFILIPTQKAPDTVGPRGGVKKGQVYEQECSYVADFVYQENGETVVEDTKGFRPDDYRIKRKLMLYIYGIRIKET